MKKSSSLFYLLLILSTMITISSNSWLSMWVGLELNMMSFIPLILNKSNKSSSEAAMIYFLVQSVSSMLMLMMALISICNYIMSINLINMLINISLLIKLGAAPFHMWMPEMMSKMEWNKCMILMTWQKIAPLMMMMNNNNNMIIQLSIIWSVVIGSLGGINQMSLRKMMGYSSINHLGWLMAMNKYINLWIIYMIIYSLMILLICWMFMNYKMYFMNQVSSINLNMMEKISFFIMMLSMGGLPPFIGFLPKWITIQSMINEKEFFIMFVMIMFSLILLMYYLRVMTSMFLSFNSSIKWFSVQNNKLLTLTIFLVNLSLPVILIMDIF
uniref:NADH-ubiquinone oxidoreductase chain 2 n=1 Tax=Priassus spiniger TaxID=2983428 RepID=A0A977XRV0_9HEMI|nr:NADH dehydrogenase subunit 2 [Priassus spiniger]UXW64237.1 NADH dehydrogenase subunit 2 [Priassus spiniger]